MTAELLEEKADVDGRSSDRTSVLANYTDRLDCIVEKLASHSLASLDVLRWAAYVLVTEEEEIGDPVVKEVLQNLYTSARATENPTTLRILDGGIGQ